MAGVKTAFDLSSRLCAGEEVSARLRIHGGPQTASTEKFNELGQLIAAHGYVVFKPNYRGSDNLGNAFQMAIVNDTGDRACPGCYGWTGGCAKARLRGHKPDRRQRLVLWRLHDRLVDRALSSVANGRRRRGPHGLVGGL